MLTRLKDAAFVEAFEADAMVTDIRPHVDFTAETCSVDVVVDMEGGRKAA
jgi:hypothetical protein